MDTDLRIRTARDSDVDSLWEIIREIAATAETMPMPREPEQAEALNGWMTPPPGRVVVAADSSDTVLGTANMHANRPAQGSHIASGSIMVAQPARGRGVGRALVRDMIDWAGRTGFAAIQFNAVVETNAPAVGLYRSEGFTIIGTAPGAFVHPRLGEVGLHIMWRQLRPLPLSHRVG